MNRQHTPGPWRWEVNLKHKGISICGAPGFDLTVMDFVRWGMDGAAPRFRDGQPGLNVMRRALISAAPELLEALTRVLGSMELARRTPFQMGDVLRDAEMIARAAIAKARGRGNEESGE